MIWHNLRWFLRALGPIVEWERGVMLSAKARKLLVRHPCLTVQGAINMAMTERDEYAKRESEAAE